MNISLCKHKSGQMLQAVKQSLTWMPESFDARFPVSVNSLSSVLSKFKCLAAKHSCLKPLWTYFLVRCPRLDPNDGSQPSRNRFLPQTPTSQDRFALRQLLWPDYSTYKSFDSSTKVIPSLHVISLAVRDRQWNELPAKFKITWRHSDRPILWRP